MQIEEVEIYRDMFRTISEDRAVGNSSYHCGRIHSVEISSMTVKKFMFLSLGVTNVLGKYKKLILLTTEVYNEVPTQFGRKYFGTD